MPSDESFASMSIGHSVEEGHLGWDTPLMRVLLQVDRTQRGVLGYCGSVASCNDEKNQRMMGYEWKRNCIAGTPDTDYSR